MQNLPLSALILAHRGEGRCRVATATDPVCGIEVNAPPAARQSEDQRRTIAAQRQAIESARGLNADSGSMRTDTSGVGRRRVDLRSPLGLCRCDDRSDRHGIYGFAVGASW
jgi:hypothetical protein